MTTSLPSPDPSHDTEIVEALALPPPDPSHDTEIVEGFALHLRDPESVRWLREHLPPNIFLLLSYRAMIFMAHHTDKNGHVQ